MANTLRKSREGTTLVIDDGRSVTISRDGALSVDIDNIVKSDTVRKQVERLRQFVDKNYPSSYKPSKP